MSEIREATVLFINDDIDEGKLLQIFLHNTRNDRVIVCDPKSQSLQAVVGERPDLILIHASSFAFDALQTYHQLRTMLEFEKTPVILWRTLKEPTEFYPVVQELGIAGCIPFVFDIEKDLLVARDIILSGGTYYPK